MGWTYTKIWFEPGPRQPCPSHYIATTTRMKTHDAALDAPLKALSESLKSPVVTHVWYARWVGTWVRDMSVGSCNMGTKTNLALQPLQLCI